MKTAILVADLDGTLVDSRVLDELRRQRKWKECVRRVADVAAFPDVVVSLHDLRNSGVSFAVVTNSVSFYAEAVLRHHQIGFDALVAWHDTSLHKPDPTPIFEALKRLGGAPRPPTYGLGDAADDCRAYHAAGIATIGAGWSTTFDNTASWETVLAHPRQLSALAGTSTQK